MGLTRHSRTSGNGKMPRTLGRQILVPLIFLQGIAIAATALVTASLVARSCERQIADQLASVAGTLGDASFPFTQPVLDRMRGLSGAHFVAYGEEGRPTAASLTNLADAPPDWGAFAPTSRLESLGDFPTVEIGGTRYFAAALRSTAGSGDRRLLILYPETMLLEARREAALPPLALGLVALALLAAVAGWVAHRISRRVRDLKQQVSRIAAGDFKELDVSARNDEIEDLVRDVNRMCGDLRTMRRAIEQSERTRLLAQLAAGMAHQLRNALTGARLSVQLHARRHPPPDGDQSLAVALRQLTMTEEQVRGLLAFGKVERRPHERVDLGRLVEDVASLVGPACEHARATLELSHGDAPVRADVSGLRAAVLNLVLNAVEAAGAGGHVRVDVFAEKEEAAVIVSDNGPGPRADVRDALAEPFVTTKPEGVGLGLALAREVAADHGGSLTWTREGEWTRFRLAIPRVISEKKEPAWAES